MSCEVTRILILDNNREYCEELASWLERQSPHYLVDFATSEMEAMGRMSETGEYDVVLVDQVLGPESDGLEAMRKIKKRYPDTGIIMYTGWGIIEHEGAALSALREEADAYLSKASDREEILLWIKRAAERRLIRRNRGDIQAIPLYDAFISYSHKDRAWVRDTLLSRLEDEGLQVCIDFRDFEPGVASLVNMENAVEHSRKTLIVLTPAWVESEWTAFESLLVQSDDPAGRRARMIPLRLKPCEPPKRIAMLTYVDFTQPSEFEFQLQRLVLAIRGEPMPDAPRRVPEPRVVSGESQEPSASDGQYLRARKESLEKELAETVADMAKVEKQYRATISVIERNRLDQELESLREHHERVRQEYDSVCHTLPERPFASQPGLPKISDLRLFVVGPAGEQSTSRLEFSIPVGDSSKKAAWEIAFHLYLDNPGPTMVHYVDIEMYVSSDTDAFWTYDYRSKPFDIVESPRPWQTTLSNTYIHCRFVGGGDFACDGEVQQNLGLVKMLVPYGQADTTLTFQYRILAEGHKSQGSFAIALKPER